jgi:hypothetical protein
MRVSLGPALGLLAGSLLAHAAILRLSYCLAHAMDVGIDQSFGFLAFALTWATYLFLVYIAAPAVFENGRAG